MARKSRSDSTESPARTGKEEDPDERGPPGGETGRGGGRWAELGQETGERAGVEKKWAAGKVFGPRDEREKEKMGWAEREGEREMILHFPKRFKHFQIKFKLKDLNLS